MKHMRLWCKSKDRRPDEKDDEDNENPDKKSRKANNGIRKNCLKTMMMIIMIGVQEHM